MRFRTSRLFFAAFSPGIFLLAVLAAPARSQNQEWVKEELAWRTQHATDLQKPDGWLSLIGLEWLQSGETTVGSAADNKIRLPATAPAHLAILKLENGSVQLLAPQSGFPSGLQVDGSPAKEQTLRADPDHDKFNSRITYSTLNFYVIRRADRFAVRLKDAKSPSLAEFHALKWYAPAAAYNITAKWVPYTPAKSVSLITLVGTSYDQPVPGYAEFTLQGKTYRLEPVLEDPQSARLFFILKDSTSADATYPACRFLYSPLPDHGVNRAGELVLDFNHLENPPCAYTPYATCPLPPAGNRLPVALPVGEQRYHK
ncbi:MAG TPA: DUF1684 domain-containing protein [Candidatus Eisenbacteria bacterium]|jgi:uncharacterized protein (DUF1684 family)|nr:DUF1684 domain-containing protein [Candidatus Eisenbacteria bacterium]